MPGAFGFSKIDPYAFDPDLARFPASRNRLAEKESRQINMLEHVLIAKPLRTLAGHALIAARGQGQCNDNDGTLGHQLNVDRHIQDIHAIVDDPEKEDTQ